MASVCPKCHAELEEDAICCAELRHTWKCLKCGKRTTGFVVPYGRCFLCGGEIETVQTYTSGDPAAAAVVQEALQFEVNTYQFYRLGGQRVTDPVQKEIFEDLALKERDHIAELEEKYHAHLDPRAVDLPVEAERLLADWLFEGIDFESATRSARTLYEKALLMERRTQEHFAKRAEELPSGPERETCLELAAEEVEHIAILETELSHLAEASAEA
jgi:rubrerythrin